MDNTFNKLNKLYSIGQVKDLNGTPWTKEEADARFIHKIPADYVRDGILTKKAYQDKKAEMDNKLAKEYEKTLIKEVEEEVEEEVKEVKGKGVKVKGKSKSKTNIYEK